MADEEIAYKPGQILVEKYRVEHVLGIGGFGAVLAATHLALEEKVAIKVLLPAAAKNASAAERFLREARAAVRIRSEHVARVSDVGTLPDGAPYMVMEHLVGQDLSALVKSTGSQRVEDVAEWVLQACEALAEAHKLGIIHRDLKPANLFLTRKVDGAPCLKVLDFGISKMTNETGDKGMTKTSDVMGSPFYMSPEQMRSTRNVDARADIWALGAILFELLAGAPPFDAETMTALVVSIMQEPPRELTHYRNDIPVGLRSVVLACLEKDPGRRFQDVASLADALAPFAPERSQVSLSRVMAISGRAARPVGQASTASTVSGLGAPGSFPAGSAPIAPTHIDPGMATARSHGVSGPIASAPPQSWGGTLASGARPSRAPMYVGIAALVVGSVGVTGFVLTRARSAATHVPDARAEAIGEPASSGPVVAERAVSNGPDVAPASSSAVAAGPRPTPTVTQGGARPTVRLTASEAAAPASTSAPTVPPHPPLQHPPSVPVPPTAKPKPTPKDPGLFSAPD